MVRPCEFSFRTRVKNLEALAHDRFDLLVVGGGITGAGVVRDAALRGLHVALVERRDFAAGTSSRSSKLIHGGLRYLGQGDVGLVIEAARERRVVRRLAPHLARPIQMLVPVHSRSGYAKTRAGLWTYDRLARVRKEERNRMLSREETLALEPLLRPEQVYGGGLYYEYLTDDARLVIENLKSAAMLGAVIVNYTMVIGLARQGDRLTAAVVRDSESGRQFQIHARTIVNAAGPWVDAVRLLQGTGERPRLHLTKGIHLVLRRERLPVSRIVVMNTPDRRAVFVVPRGPVVYLGTTDTDYDGEYDQPAITRRDLEYLLDAANATFSIERLGADDVVGAWAGLRPLLHQDGKKPTELSRKDEIMVGASGLISVAGGKLTTYRKMAQRVVTIVAQQLAQGGQTRPAPRGHSESRALSGGATGSDVGAFAERMKRRVPSVAADIVDRLVTVYGSNAAQVLDAMARDPQAATRCAPDGAITRGEVAYAVQAEMALTLEDFLERRSRVFLFDPGNGLAVAPEAARQMGELLGWTARRVEAEIAGYRQHVQTVKTFVSDSDTTAPPRVAHA
ncbi:MAG: FAD-dependent oxidoreductase [Candidatus Binatia bacterium]